MTTRHATHTRTMLLVLLAGASSALGQTALFAEGDPIGDPGFVATGLGNVNVNRVGGFCVGVTSSDGGAILSNFWGNPTGGPGALLRTESTIGTLTQTSFESFFGYGDAGQIAYSALTNDSGGATSLDGAWLDGAVVFNELDPVPGLAGMFSNFNSRPTSTAAGVPWWVGGITDTPGGLSMNRALFMGLGPTIVIKGGDAVAGVAEPIRVGSNIDFDFRVSANGSHWINQVLLDASSTVDGLVVVDGAAATVGGSIAREDFPVPPAAGGLGGERWDNFDFFGITESGSMLITGDTNGSSRTDEFIVIDDAIVLREGAFLSTPIGDGSISGSIEAAALNESGDWAAIWDMQLAPGNVEVLIVNGEVLVVETMGADMDGDGSPDAPATLANFTGIANLAISERVGGNLDVYYTADIDTLGTSTSSDDTEILYRLRIPVAGGCAPDLTGSADPNDPGFGVPDGILDANDFFFYLGLFGSGDLAADLTGSLDPNDPGFGVPDGVLDANDFFFYLDLFAQGCP